MNGCDVLILGDGPCGMVAAISLARRGVSVKVCSRTPSRHSRIETLHSLEVLQHTVPNIPMDAFRRHEGGITWWTGSEEATSPGWTVDRAQLHRALHEVALAAGVSIVPQSAQIGAAALRINAAGRHGGLPRQHLTQWRQVGITASVRALHPLPPVWSEPLTNGWLWLVQHKSRAELTVFTDPDGSPPARLAEMLAQSRIAQRVVLTGPTLCCEVTPSVCSCGAEPGPTILPAGDAAVSRDPLAAQGLNAALSDGAAVAVAALECFKGERGKAEQFLLQRRDLATRRHVREITTAYSRAGRHETWWKVRGEGTKRFRLPVPAETWHPSTILRRSETWNAAKGLTLMREQIVETTLLLPDRQDLDPVVWFGGHPVHEFLPAWGEACSAGAIVVGWVRRGLIKRADAPFAIRWFVENGLLTKW